MTENDFQQSYIKDLEAALASSLELNHAQAERLDKIIPKLVKANGLIENLRIRINELEHELELRYTQLQVEEMVMRPAKPTLEDHCK